MIEHNIQEGDEREQYVLSRGEYVRVMYKRMDIPWDEEGFPDVIPGVLVGVDPATDEILVYPKEATPTIKAWREKMIAKHDLSSKRNEQAELEDDARALEDQLTEYEQLGLLDEYGCLDEEKYEAWQAAENDMATPSTNEFDREFGELRSRLSRVPMEPYLIFQSLAKLEHLNEPRYRAEAEPYALKSIATSTGRSMYEEKHLKLVYEHVYQSLEDTDGSSKHAWMSMSAGDAIGSATGAAPRQHREANSVATWKLGLISFQYAGSRNPHEFSVVHNQRSAIYAAITDWEANQNS